MPINHQALKQHALLNRLQSLLLLGIMAGFLALLGNILWGSSGLYILLLMGALLLLFNPIARPWLIMRMYKATPLAPAQAPALHSALQELTLRSELQYTPALFYIPGNALNAFAVGRPNEAAIAVTDGLLRSLTTREIIAVLAHEISHIKNNDMWVMSIADLFSRLTSALSLFGQLLLFINLPVILLYNVHIDWLAIALLIFAPNLSALAQLGLSRSREYAADLHAAKLTHDPQALASALLKIEQNKGSIFERVMLPGRRIPEPSLLRTHPPTHERVEKLLSLKHSEAESPVFADSTAYPQPRNFQKSPQGSPHWHINGLWY
ncbi:hypothetical protein MNBD_GAMMA09-294 [hydrothermal vent metagenome]|uniref:Peptidase M48 domain-containing protein n=1 Tax=hydrothermal vent metagenome TaxID=652676 RepID=A0A3B0Y195_9ZZZZ